MISHTTQAFRTAFAQLPVQVQKQAREAYKLFRQNPYHPSLRWKHVHPTKPIYSVRVGRGYRAVGIRVCFRPARVKLDVQRPTVILMKGTR